jgi:hypothetical protein
LNITIRPVLANKTIDENQLVYFPKSQTSIVNIKQQELPAFGTRAQESTAWHRSSTLP